MFPATPYVAHEAIPSTPKLPSTYLRWRKVIASKFLPKVLDYSPTPTRIALNFMTKPIHWYTINNSIASRDNHDSH